MTEHAFPFDDSADKTVNPGMTLRDYFAAKALPTIINSVGGVSGSETRRLDVAFAAYQMADAMLKAREQK